MSISLTTLTRAVATLRSPGATPEARSAAAGTAYIIALPLLTQRCDTMLATVAPAHWTTGEDLAAAALLPFVLDVGQVRTCRSTSASGILAFLRRNAFFDLLDTREARAERETGARGLLTARVDDAVLASQTGEPDAHHTSEDDDAFWRSYRLAVRELPAHEQHAWLLCVEQEFPMADVARHAGVDRTTVWRHVQAAAARLRAGLESALPEWRRRSLGRTRPVSPRRGR